MAIPDIMATPDVILVVGMGGSDLSSAIAFNHPELIVADIKTVSADQTKNLPIQDNRVFLIEDVNKHLEKGYKPTLKDVKKHPFEKFIHGKKRHRR